MEPGSLEICDPCGVAEAHELVTMLCCRGLALQPRQQLATCSFDRWRICSSLMLRERESSLPLSSEHHPQLSLLNERCFRWA